MDTANFTLSAGGQSTCFLTLQERVDAVGKGGKAVDALSEDIPLRLQTLQSLVFAQAKTAYDSAVTVIDGVNQLNFRGYLSNPSFSNAPGSMGPSYTLMHESAILGNYRSHIYQFSELERQINKLNPFQYKQTDADIAVRFMSVLDQTVKDWVNVYSKNVQTEVPISIEQKAAWHKMNLVVYPYLKAVMDASKGAVVWDLFSQLTDVASQGEISTYIASLLSEKYDSFTTVLEQFERSFQCLFVPSFPPDASQAFGKLVSYHDIAAGKTTPLKLPITVLQFSGGNRAALPVTHVLVQGAVNQSWRTNAISQGRQGTPTPMLAAWPPTVYAGGRVLVDSGPPWMRGILPQDFAASAVFDPAQGLDLSVYQSGRVKINVLINKLYEVKADIMQQWAKNLYEFSSLENSTCNLEVPLDVSIVPGQRYAVQNMSGTQFFTGFLAQVAHRISVQGRAAGSAGVAVTSLTFTHLNAGNFTLPES